MKKQTTNSGIFAKFENIGETVNGEFNGFYETQYGLLIKIGEKLVNLNKAQLKSIIGNHYTTFKKGKTKIKIEFVDEQSKKGRKNALKIFDVYIDNKKVDSGFSGNELLDDKKISKYFSE